MSKVIIKCFETPLYKYLYDRYTDSIVRVTDNEYNALQEVEESKQLTGYLTILKRLTDNWLLHETIIEKIEHPETKNIRYLSENRINDLILQVTQQCNLR